MNPRSWLYSLFTASCILCGLGLGTLATTPGCASTQKNTYRASGITHASVKAAMHSWNLYVASGRATVEDEKKVRAAYNRYRETQLAVINAAQQLAVVPDEGAAGDRLTAQVTAYSAALAELLNLLAVYGVKP